MNTINSAALKKVPGDLAMWIFIMAELAVFALLLISIALAAHQQPETFRAGVQTLHPIFGLLNTFALLSGSACLVYAVEQSHDYPQRILRGLFATLLLGGVYVLFKSIEYYSLWQAGYHLRSGTFYFLYYFVTFFHFMHVLLGMVIVFVVRQRIQQGTYPQIEDQHAGLESAGSYWHMVDLVWLVLFPLLYLVYL